MTLLITGEITARKMTEQEKIDWTFRPGATLHMVGCQPPSVAPIGEQWSRLDPKLLESLTPEEEDVD